MTAHFPIRPAWTCAHCQAAWPCATARHHLPTEYADDPLALGVYLGTCLVDAAADLPHVEPPALYARIVGWTRSARSGRT